MTKTELAANVAAKAEISKTNAAKAVEAWIETVTETLSDGDNIQSIGFGTFEVRDRAARVGHNPTTREEIQISACKVAVFKAGKKLKDAVNVAAAKKKKKK